MLTLPFFDELSGNVITFVRMWLFLKIKIHEHEAVPRFTFLYGTTYQKNVSDNIRIKKF